MNAIHRKTTLFCPQCWHEAPFDGDWLDDAASGRYACPDYGATITTRRRRHDRLSGLTGGGRKN